MKKLLWLLKRCAMRYLCVLRGHYYVPSFYHQYEQKAWWAVRENERFTYECEDCGAPITVHGRAAHKAFIMKHNPSWGGRGSDSQGTREED